MEERDEKQEQLEKKWYVINTYAGQERKVKEYLERRKTSMGLEDSLFQVIVAEEKVDEVKNGKKRQKSKNLFSGYILVEMIMTDEAWYKVRNTPGVTGFIGSSGKGAKPFPVPQEEVDAVLRQMNEVTQTPDLDFVIGDTVRILNKAFEGSVGTVESIDLDRQTAKVKLALFNRETDTEVSLTELEKVSEEF